MHARIFACLHVRSREVETLERVLEHRWLLRRHLADRRKRQQRRTKAAGKASRELNVVKGIAIKEIEKVSLPLVSMLNSRSAQERNSLRTVIMDVTTSLDRFRQDVQNATKSVQVSQVMDSAELNLALNNGNLLVGNDWRANLIRRVSGG